MPGRTPGGGAFCRRSASFFSCSSTSLALVAVVRGAPYSACILPHEWCNAVARAMRTVCCTCLNIERSRRSRRRRAAPKGCPLDSAIIGHTDNKGHRKPV